MYLAASPDLLGNGDSALLAAELFFENQLNRGERDQNYEVR